MKSYDEKGKSQLDRIEQLLKQIRDVVVDFAPDEDFINIKERDVDDKE